ncbi:hypothetical protein QZH41_012276 [Actinostola sp. cb2023]|nr:hypothetical protein QZH41_012276 [Actinostola sp. cb2023]
MPKFNGLLFLYICVRLCMAANGGNPPSFTDNISTSPTNSIGVVAEGQTVTFNCKADDGRLVIANAQHAKDDGYYFCVAKNNHGAALSKRAKLRVAYAQSSTILSSILLGPSDKVAIHKKQQSVTFECFATGNPMPTTTWKKDGQVISSNSKYDLMDHNKRLKVKSIQSNDQGTYSCHVSNPKSVGAGTRTATLVVYVMPSWTRTPSNATAKVLNSVTFSCLATGNPTPKYTWYHNGVPVIQGSSARKSINTNNNDLTISSIIENDRGMVQCVAWNVAGHVIGTARLTVDGIPVWIDVPPTDRTVTLGETIELPCQARGSVTPSINWKKDGTFIGFYASGSRFHLKSSGSLQITNTQKSDSGIYVCIATTPSGYRNASATLKVLSKTNITTPLPSTIKAIKGHPKVLIVGVTHDKNVALKFTWTKDGATITDARVHILANGSLYISRVQESDAGNYKCFVYSLLGNGTTSGRIVVQETPLSPSRPVVVSIQSTSVRLTWDPPGYNGNSAIISYNVEYQKENDNWKLALQNVNPSSKVSAVVTGLKPYTRYKFRVRAVNGVGVGLPSDATAFITTYSAPPSQAPSNVLGTPASAESILVQWKVLPADSHNGVLEGFRIAYRQSGIQGSSFSIKLIANGLATRGTVTGLLRWTEYEIKVQAYNSAGAGPFSSPVLLMTGEGVMMMTMVALMLFGSDDDDDDNGGIDSVGSDDDDNVMMMMMTMVALMLSGSDDDDDDNDDVDNDGIDSDNGGVMLMMMMMTMVALMLFGSDDDDDDNVMMMMMMTMVALILSGSDDDDDDNVLMMTMVALMLSGSDDDDDDNGGIDAVRSDDDDDDNGGIDSLRAWEPSTPNVVVEQTVNHDSSKSLQHGTLSNLKKYTQYELLVLAVNGAGAGPASTKLLVKTQQGIPDAVSSLSISEVYSDGFRVSWSRPTQVNGHLVAYVLQCWQNDSKLSTLKTYRISDTTLAYVTTGLKPKTLYTVSVAAETQAGTGSATMLNVKTVDSPVAPDAPSKPEIVEARAWKVLLRWTPGFSGRAPIREYNIQYNDDSFYDPVTAQWKSGLVVRDAYRVFQLFPLVVPHMRPNTGYHFRVIATNAAGSSPPSNVSDRVMTLETAPSRPPSDLTVHPRDNAGELEIRWKIPSKDSWNSASIGYLIVFVPSSSSQHNLTIQVPNAYVTKYNVGGLLMYTKYKISIKAYNLNGKGPSNTSTEVFYTTAEGAPVQPPTNVKTKVVSSTAIELKWGPVSAVGRNGKILGYKIFHRVVGQTIEQVTRVQSASTYSFVISNLESFVVYEFEILAYTRHGLGPKSIPVRAKTLESIPGPPARVRFSHVEKDSVKLLWNPPIYPHGNITGYRVAYRRNQSSSSFLYEDSNIASTRRSDVLLGLLDKTHYRFFVWAKTIKGWGPAAEQVVYTTDDKAFPPDTPFIFPIPTESVFERSVIIEWRIIEYPTSPYRYFTLQFEGSNGGWLDYSTNLNAKLRKLKVEGLLPGTRYRFRIMATNDVGDSQYSSPSQQVTTNPTVPTGAPRDVRIKADSPMSLVVEWTAPSPAEIGGTLQGFIIKYKKKGTSHFFALPQLSSSVRKYVINGFEVFTTYYIVIAVVNEKGAGKFTPELPGTTGELAPSKGPTDVANGTIKKTSISVKWKAPPLSSINGYLQGYKVFFEGEVPSRRRRRRRSIDYCQINKSPNYVDVDHDKEEVTIRNLHKYVKYSIWIRAYNSKGVSPSSAVVKVTTLPDVPGPIINFDANSVYNDRVHLSWHKPCEPNGIIISYEITYFKMSSSIKSKITVEAHMTSYVLTGLAMLTEYTFQIRLKNHIDFGPFASFIARTKGPAVLPGTPGKPYVRATSDSAVISWQNGHSGNVPFTEFEIQSRIPGQGDFKTKWTISPKDLQKNKTFVSCTVGNLKPKTSYQFRIIAWNKVGKSPPSPPSDISPTSDGVIPPPLALHEEAWFISVTALLGVILVFVVIGIVFICIRRRKENMAERLSTTGSSNRNTLELKDNRQTGSLPGLHVAYRDPNHEDAEVSSLGSKDGMSDSASGDENYLDKDSNKPSFVNHYANNPNHQSWRTTFDNQDDDQAKYDDYPKQIVDLPEEFQRPRFKSFSSLEDKEFPDPPPPAYESHAEDEYCFKQLPPESVTSFMSPEYEAAKKSMSLGRPRSALMRHSPYDSQDEVDGKRRPVYGSQNQIDQHPPRRSREDLRPSRRRSRDHFDAPLPYDSPDEVDGRRRPVYGSQDLIDQYPPRRSREDLQPSRRRSRDHFDAPLPYDSPDEVDGRRRPVYGSQDLIDQHPPRRSREDLQPSRRRSRDHFDAPLPYDSQDEVDGRRRPVYGSQDLIDQHPPRRSREDLRPSRRRSRDHFDAPDHRKPKIDGLPYGSREEVDGRRRPVYGSQNLIEQYPPRRSREDLRPSHRRSRDHFDAPDHRKPKIDGFSYATMPNPRVLSRQHDLHPSAFQRPSDADVSSEVSSSSNDQRDPRQYHHGPKPPRYPKPEYTKEPGRRRNRPSNLTIPPNNYPEQSTSSGSPTSTVSPAPSYHSNYDDYEAKYRTLPTRVPPPLEYTDQGVGEPEPLYQNTLPRREPMMVIQHGFSHGYHDDDEVQISPYQSFV